MISRNITTVVRDMTSWLTLLLDTNSSCNPTNVSDLKTSAHAINFQQLETHTNPALPFSQKGTHTSSGHPLGWKNGTRHSSSPHGDPGQSCPKESESFRVCSARFKRAWVKNHGHEIPSGAEKQENHVRDPEKNNTYLWLQMSSPFFGENCKFTSIYKSKIRCDTMCIDRYVHRCIVL